MNERRLLAYGVLLTLAPILVAWFDLSVPGAILFVLLLLLLRWIIVLSGIAAPEKTPELVLVSISASHFVEKVRWSMDRLGLDYVEKPAGGTLGAFFRGRTVPQLKMRTGAVQSSIGNSAEILRYLWGRYAVERGEDAAFLEPTRERVELEARLDRHGANLQVWVYYHLLNDRELSLRAWGAENPVTPPWQRLLLRLLFPLQRFMIRRAFRITDASYAKAVTHIETLLDDLNRRLADGRQSLLGGDAVNYTDLAFAAMTGLWLTPEGYAAGHADAVRIAREDAPPGMREDVNGWESSYPLAASFVTRLYAEERTPAVTA